MLVAGCLWACTSLSCAHAEQAPAPAPAAIAAEAAPAPPPAIAAEGAPSPPAAIAAEAAPAPPPAEASPKPAPPEPAPSCAGAAGAAPPAFHWPARGAVTSSFGVRAGAPHEGIDISSRAGMFVRAAAPGTVVFSDYKRGYGRVIVLKHAGGYETVYAHNQDNLVMRGARVERGEVIADMGSTGESSGPHLHFEVRVGARPIDPLACLPARTKARP